MQSVRVVTMNSTKTIHISLSVIILSLIFTTAHSIRCYNCSSHLDVDCLEIRPSNDSSFLVDCPRSEDFCRKTVQVVISESRTIVKRSCGYIRFEKYPGDYCMLSNTNFKKERSCQCFTDECNKGGLIAPDKLFLLGVFALISLSGR